MQAALHGGTELLVLFLQESDALLEGLQEELLADPASLGVLTVALSVAKKEKGRSTVRTSIRKGLVIE